ncbi:MAG: hypothetical protein GY711_02760, partial [bacterium]|nr:hypothetical protein [bacterium]
MTPVLPRPLAFGALGALLCLLADRSAGQCSEEILTAIAGHARDGFGEQVRIADDQIVVGMPFYTGNHQSEGAVVVYERAGAGWVEAQFITAPNPGAQHHFGLAIAADRDDLMVRERVQDPVLFPEGGSVVHVYRRRGTQWVWSQKIEAPVPGAPGVVTFARTFVLDENSAYFGDVWYDIIRVYDKIGGTWVPAGVITTANYNPLPLPPSGGIPGRIRANGDRLLVTTNSSLISGEWVYVLERDGSGWHGSARLVLQGLHDEPDVAMTGDTIFVGSPHESGQAGRVWVYEKSGNQWSPTQVLTPEPWLTLARFGFAVEVNSGILAVSAPGWAMPAPAVGRVYLFEHDGVGWYQTRAIDGAQPIPERRMGQDLAMSADVLVAGAPAGGAVVGIPGTA